MIDPLLQYISLRIEKSRIMLLQDHSASMIIIDRNGRTRFNKSKSLLQKTVFSHLEKKFNLQYFLFDRDIVPSDKKNILSLGRPEGDMTDLGGALLKDEYIGLMEEAGFRVEIVDEDRDISKRQYEGYPVESLKVAAHK